MLMSQKGILMDELLMTVRDLRWHDISEITARTGMSKEDVEMVLKFMNDFGVIYRKGGKIRINRKVLRCLLNE